MPRVCLPAVAAIIALIVVVLTSGASGEELLVNGGFESGDTQGWNATGSLQASNSAHSGVYAGQLTSDGLALDAKMYQSVLVQASRTYELSAWILDNDPLVQQVLAAYRLVRH